MEPDDICISVNGVSYPVLCGLCNSKIDWVGETDGQSGNAGCVSCDNIGEIKEIGKLTVEFAKREGQLILNRKARDVARKSKGMTFSGQTAHNEVHRFIIELKI